MYLVKLTKETQHLEIIISPERVFVIASDQQQRQVIVVSPMNEDQFSTVWDDTVDSAVTIGFAAFSEIPDSITVTDSQGEMVLSLDTDQGYVGSNRPDLNSSWVLESYVGKPVLVLTNYDLEIKVVITTPQAFIIRLAEYSGIGFVESTIPQEISLISGLRHTVGEGDCHIQVLATALHPEKKIMTLKFTDPNTSDYIVLKRDDRHPYGWIPEENCNFSLSFNLEHD